MRSQSRLTLRVRRPESKIKPVRELDVGSEVEKKKRKKKPVIYP